ncbi:hypothetical protein BGX20_004986, partial [Mortierella sp. AD010]
MGSFQSRGGSSHQTGPSRPGGKSGDPQPTHPTVDYRTSPTAVDAMGHNITPPPNRMIFAQSAPLPATRYALPESGESLTTTPQLAYCLSLIQPSLVPNDGLDEIEHKWSQHILNDEVEQERLKAMPAALIKAFIQEAKNRYTVTEIVSLAAILEQDDFRKLFRVFVDEIDQSVLQEVDLLNGLSQLIRNAPQEYIGADDVATILRLLHQRLVDTHTEFTGRTYRMVLTLSNMLSSMVDSQVKGLSYDQFSTPLEGYLCELQKSADAYLIYQVAYASQALMHISDNESVLRTTLQRTEKVARGISGVVGAVKTLNITGIVDGLNNIQFDPTGLENMAKP